MIKNSNEKRGDCGDCGDCGECETQKITYSGCLFIARPRFVASIVNLIRILNATYWTF